MDQKNDDGLIQEMHGVLNSLYQKGMGQVDLLISQSKEEKIINGPPGFVYYRKILMPRKSASIMIITEPAMFTRLLLKEYWNFYKTIIDNIESPAVQFLVRPLLEYTYSQIICYCNKNEKEKRIIATKYWLCASGLFSRENDSIVGFSYNDLLAQLDDKEQKVFKEIQDQGFPSEKLHQILYKLFPFLNKNNLPKELEESIKNIYDKKIGLDWIDQQYRFFSLFVHPNVFMLQSLHKSPQGRSHLYRVVGLIAICALNTVDFTSDHFLEKGTFDSAEIKNKVKALMQELIQYTNLKQ